MAPVRNARVVMKERPGAEEYPEPGKHTVVDSTPTIDLDSVQLGGGFLVKMLYFSIDPSIRGRMARADPIMIIDVRSRQSVRAKWAMRPPFKLLKRDWYCRMFNFGIGVVLRSENPEVKAGDHIEGIMGALSRSWIASCSPDRLAKGSWILPDIQEYNIRHTLKEDTPGLTLNRIENTHNIPWSVYVGVLGMPGKTAYYGWKAYAKAKAGEVIYVSTGAGPVGSFVIQLAKQDGLKVIASAGSEEKIKFLKELGVDVAFNYKTTKTSEVLEKEGPIDIYWDHVGGEMLEAALTSANKNGRVIVCGAIAGYNSGNAQPVRNLYQIIYKSVTIQGLYIFDHEDKYKEEFYKIVPEWIAKGKIKYTEEVQDGLEKVGEAILAQQKGQNIAKSVIKVADE
ncbi:hypothetical protein V5O48_018697 [Marasmius crinis-equi]|uniref:Enoyl reductase (ER) domain-containing protein n=1 Tax=Marasmius crinis-equi TaxID=585013 RepID=A0ABR3EKF8_9AGAR